MDTDRSIVSLTATDFAGASGTQSLNLSETAPPPTGDDIVLPEVACMVQGRKMADLTWVGNHNFS